MLIAGAVIISQVQCLQPLTGLLNKANLVLILRQIQVTGIQANTHLIAVQCIDQQQNILNGFCNRLMVDVFQTDNSISSFNMPEQIPNTLQISLPDFLYWKLTVPILHIDMKHSAVNADRIVQIQFLLQELTLIFLTNLCSELEVALKECNMVFLCKLLKDFAHLERITPAQKQLRMLCRQLAIMNTVLFILKHHIFGVDLTVITGPHADFHTDSS